MSVRFRLSVSRLFDRVSVSVDLVSVCDRVEITKEISTRSLLYGTVRTVLYCRALELYCTNRPGPPTRPPFANGLCERRGLYAGRPAAPETQAGFSVIRLKPSASAWKRIFQRRWLCPRTSASAPTFTAAAEASEFRRDCCCCTQANQKLRAQQCLRRIAISWN